ncbi:DUF4843 domain-containing protein [Bacteroidota bacterium]
MKKYIKNIILTCTVALSIMACTEDKLDLYDGAGKSILYFQWSVDGFRNDVGNKLDSISVSFASRGEEITDSIYNIPVKILGNLSNIDRPFKVQVLPASTAVEGVDYTMPDNVFIPAQSATGVLPITLLRSQTMLSEAVSIEVRLVANENFDTNYYGSSEKLNSNVPLKYNEFKLIASDILNKPLLWSSVVGILGEYSAKKFRLYASVNNIPLPNWDNSLDAPGIFFARARALANYLIENRANNTPILEDDGTEMRLAPYLDPL